MTVAMFLVATVVLAVCLIAGAIVYSGAPLTEEPGLVARLKHFASTNSARTDLNSQFPELRWSQIPMDADTAVDRIEAISEKLGWQLQVEPADTSAGSVTHRLNAVVTTRLLRFNDNIQIEIQQLEKNLSNITVFSASNVGKGDFGANLAHILKLRQMLDGG